MKKKSNFYSTNSLELEDFNTLKSNFKSRLEEHSPTNNSKENFTFGEKCNVIDLPKNTNKLFHINLSKIHNSHLNSISNEEQKKSAIKNIDPIVLFNQDIISEGNKIPARQSVDDLLDSLNIRRKFSQNIGLFKKNKQ